MKKLLLFFCSLFVALGLSAETVTMSYTGSTTTNLTGENDAALVGLDATAWSVVGAKGDNSNFPGLNKAGDIRLYFGTPTSNTITVSSLEGATINSITVTFTAVANATAGVTVNGQTVDGVTNDVTTTWQIGASEFVLHNIATTSTQVRFKTMVIDYTPAGDGPTGPTETDVTDLTNKIVTAVTLTSTEDLVPDTQWYLLRQKRDGYSPAQDNGAGQIMTRAASDDVVAEGDAVSTVAKYMLRLISTENDGAYKLLWGTGNYWANGSMTTVADESEAGVYNVYAIGGNAGHYGLNAYDMAQIVDNNGLGNTLAFWESGAVTTIGGNNDWEICPVDIRDMTAEEIAAAEEAAAQAERTAAFIELLATAKAAYNANSSFILGDNLITSADQLSSPYTETREGKIEYLLDGDSKTYWHSSWASEPGLGVHYIEAALVSELTDPISFRFTRRPCNNDHITKVSVWGYGEKNEELAKEEGVLLGTFDLPFGSNTETLTTPAFVTNGHTHLRFYAENTTNPKRGYWHMSEMALCPSTLDETCINALNPNAAGLMESALYTAQELDPAQVATSDIEALQAALDAYLEAVTPLPVINCAQANALAKDEKAELGAFEVVYVNGGYTYIKDESGMTLLYKFDYGLHAGDQVAAGMVVVGSPYNNLPEAVPVTEYAALSITPNADYAPEFPVATEAPSMDNLNTIVVYGGVTVDADAAFNTEKNNQIVAQWNGQDILFFNKFKLEQTLEAGKSYTITGVNTVIGQTLEVYPIDIFSEELEDPQDFTNLIVNADLTTTEGWDATGTKGISGGLCKVGNAANFDFKQTITVPAGQYLLTAQAAYRYAGSEEAELAAIQAGEKTHYAQLYATVGDKTVTADVMNRYEGASKVDHANGNGSVALGDLFVPNSSSAVQAWFAAGEYVNEVIFNAPVDGEVTIGIVKAESPAEDYTVLGPWTLRRLGDAEVEDEPVETIDVANGDYLVQNVATGTFLNGANEWGTRASVVKHGQFYTFTRLNDGKYTLDSHISNGGNSHYLGDGGFTDSPAANLDVVMDADSIVTFALNGKYLTANTTDTRVDFAADEVSELAQWRIITRDEVILAAADATADAPMDLTNLLPGAGFNRNNLYNNQWNWEWAEAGSTNHDINGVESNNVCESFHTGFKVSQSIEVPNGIYAVTAQGFYRQDGEDNDNLPFFFANDAQATFVPLTGGENNMRDASNAFSAGKYAIEPMYVEVTDGVLNVGVSNMSNNALWVIFDNFELTYYGAEGSVQEIALKSLIDAYKEALQAATEQVAKEMLEEDKVETTEALAALTMTDFANANEDILHSLIDELNTLAATAERYARKYSNNILAQEKIAAGEYELTELIVNPSFEMGNLTGWVSEAGGNVANNGNFGAATGTWFVEKWINNATLADGVLSQVIEGLPSGNYKLTAQAQNVNQYNAETVTGGFFIFANDAQAEVTAVGTTKETTDYAVEFTIEDGVLTLGARLEGCTGNWMSVDNFQLFWVPETMLANASLINGEESEDLVDGGSYAAATSLQLQTKKAYQNLTVAISKMVWNDPDPEWGETEGYYTEEEVALEMPEMDENGDWTVLFIKQPQNFAEGFDYQIKVRGFEGEMFDEEWMLMPYDEQILTIHGTGEQDAIEVEMGFAMVEVLGQDEETWLVSPSDYAGVVISYAENNVAEALGDAAANAVLRVTEAFLCEMDENGNFDLQNPVASLTEPKVAEGYDSIVLFEDAALESGKQYVVYVPVRAIQLFDLGAVAEESAILWCNAGPWDELNVPFATTEAEETGIQGIDMAKLANGKYLRGNQIIIVKDGKLYNAKGVQLK